MVAYALLAKIVLYTYNHFKKVPTPSLHSPHYRCLLNNNKEIEKHINELKNGKLRLSQIDKKHSYETNIFLIHANLCEHLRNALKENKVNSEDIFISFFHDETFDLYYKKLCLFKYASHYDQVDHSTSTDVIDIKSKQQQNYAGSKAIKTKKIITCVKINKSDYVTERKERRKTIKHYYGIPLKIGANNVVALLNIEFHNHSIFKTKKEMSNFFKKEIQAFVYLYEYQIHKKYFFNHLNEKVITS